MTYVDWKIKTRRLATCSWIVEEESYPSVG